MEKSIIGNSHRLGILGGGQLGRMFIQEAINYNVHVHIMDNNENVPSFQICSSFTKGDITNYNDVLAFGKTMDVLTVEIENVNVDALYALEKLGVKIFPQPRVLEIIKDKGLQKEFYKNNNIPTSEFKLLEEKPDLITLKSHLPFVQKLRTGGYDGKGVQVIKTESDLNFAFNEPSIAEDLVPFVKELSVIVARNENGDTAVYPTVECEFNDANLVEFLFSPADISTETEEKAKNLAIDVISKLDMVGLLAVELFLLKNGELLVNEIAPRPHNSGHHTIECNDTSQFEQHLRSILNMPLGSTEIVRFGTMINLIGSENGKASYYGINEAIKIPGVHIHLYGKEFSKKNRKMGHVTITAGTIADAIIKTKSVKELIEVKG